MSQRSDLLANALGVLVLGGALLFLAMAAAAQPSSEEFATSTAPLHDSVLIHYDVEVPMRDGFSLSTDVYRPAYVEEALPAI